MQKCHPVSGGLFMQKLYASVCLLLALALGCAAHQSVHSTTVRSIALGGGRQDPFLRERLLGQIRSAQIELNSTTVRAVGRRGGIEVRIDGSPRRISESVAGRILEIQSRLDGLLGQYAVQYGVGAIWCEDPSREGMPFQGMVRHEDQNLRVHCFVADPTFVQGRRPVDPLLTLDREEVAAASSLVHGQYEVSRYPLPPLPVIAGPTPRPLICHVAGE